MFLRFRCLDLNTRRGWKISIIWWHTLHDLSPLILTWEIILNCPSLFSGYSISFWISVLELIKALTTSNLNSASFQSHAAIPLRTESTWKPVGNFEWGIFIAAWPQSDRKYEKPLEVAVQHAAQWTSPRNTSNFRGFAKRKVSSYGQSIAEGKINRWKRERPRHCASGTVSGAFFRVLVMRQFI